MSHLDIIRFKYLVERVFLWLTTFSVSFNSIIYDMSGAEMICISGCYSDMAGKMGKTSLFLISV